VIPSRIARRVPSPLLATSCNNSSNTTTTQAVQVCSVANCNLTLSEAGLRCAGSPSRIPWLAQGQTRTSTSSDLCPTPGRRMAPSSLMSNAPSPSPEVNKRSGVGIQYPTPPVSAEIKHARFFQGPLAGSRSGTYWQEDGPYPCQLHGYTPDPLFSITQVGPVWCGLSGYFGQITKADDI
jgi:hypothetical protein